jgi:hypothetical protein
MGNPTYLQVGFSFQLPFLTSIINSFDFDFKKQTALSTNKASMYADFLTDKIGDP